MSFTVVLNRLFWRFERANVFCIVTGGIRMIPYPVKRSTAGAEEGIGMLIRSCHQLHAHGCTGTCSIMDTGGRHDCCC